MIFFIQKQQAKLLDTLRDTQIIKQSIGTAYWKKLTEDIAKPSGNIAAQYIEQCQSQYALFKHLSNGLWGTIKSFIPFTAAATARLNYHLAFKVAKPLALQYHKIALTAEMRREQSVKAKASIKQVQNSNIEIPQQPRHFGSIFSSLNTVKKLDPVTQSLSRSFGFRI
jgi:hypothetical protein